MRDKVRCLDATSSTSFSFSPSPHLHSLLDAIMSEPVLLERDDVEVLNRPAAREVYEQDVVEGGAGMDDL